MTTPLQRLDSSKLKNNRQAREESFDSILTAPDWTSTTPLALSHAMTPATSHGSGVSKLDTLSSHEPKLKSRSQGASSSIGSSRSSRKPSRAFLMSQPFFRTLRFPSSSPWHLYSTKQTTRQPHASSREHSCETIRTASDSAAPAPIEEDARNFSTKNSTEQEVPLSARQKEMNSGINTQNSRTSQANLLRADNPIASHLQPPIQLTKRRKVSPTLPANPAKDKYRSLGSPLAYRLPTYPMGASNHLNSVSSSPPPHPSNSQFADGSSLFGPVPLNPPHTNSRLSSHSATSSPLSSLPPSSPPLSSLPPSSPPPATPDLLTSPVFGSLSEDLPPSSPPRAIFSPISSSPLSSVPDHIYLNKGPQQAIHHFPTSSPLSSVPDHIYLDIGQPETVWSIPKSSSLSSLPDKDILTLHVSAGNTPGSEGSSASLVSIRRSPSPETVDYTNLVERTCGEQEPFVGHVARQGSLPEVEGAWKSPRPRSPVHRNYALDREESKPLQILPDRVSTYDRHVILPPSQVESDPEPKDEEDDLAWTLQEALQETGVDSRPPFEDEQEDIKGGTISAAAFARGSSLPLDSKIAE
ncbi:hypothetical protein FRC07_007123 [Ceratobasidium sp. 392]|nr:hypothetical protein FRC07_007123 [Ceratobasidium sp. 392]